MSMLTGIKMIEYNYRQHIDKHGFIIPPDDYSSFIIDNIVTTDIHMREIISLSKRISKSDAPVVILGPSGVGKEIHAELIHNNSKRVSNPFICLNCAAIPENLMESEFFGYEAGSFTGASRAGKKGLIELAEGGTLFLDEIGEMPLIVQAKLLRVLQDGKFLKIGARKELHSNIRLIAATHKSFDKMIEIGEFREDLYFRLNVIPIKLPTLVERKNDIPILCLYFIDSLEKQYHLKKKICVTVMEALVAHSWPGNIRELKNIVERLYLISLNEEITENDLSYANFASLKYDSVERGISYDFSSNNEMSLKDMISKYEIEIILSCVKKYGSIRKAAKVLRVTPSTLSRKLSTYNLDKKI